ncbi:MAG: hypothetical protein Q8K96_07855 [Rubrivivax sp.]|nr:hypothetical protein [Rubrivivax sp.]
MAAFRPTHRRLRHTVWVTLLAWLFALTAGVVNACALATPSSAVREFGAVAQASHAGHAGTSEMPGAAGHDGDGTVAHPDPGRDTGKDNCLKFCDDQSSALSKDKVAGVDPGAAFAAGVDLRSPVSPFTAVETRLSLQRPFAQGPPLVIRLLRLTL